MEENENIQEENMQNETNQNVDNIQEELDNTTDRLKRLMAEFDNFKKRSAKERDLLYNSVLSDVVCKLLPVIDNLETAVNAETEDANYKQGIDLVLKQYIEVLSSFGVKQIESVGKTFDPELHEAVSMVQDDTLGEKEIKEEYRKGYMIGDKVIRHSMVIVAN
ncbi:MAG: nucleotide exchange factor GrpE [Clostridia bacterium]|jgi:molecular chaperone GrpE|nr:nucleotide exchange factor GrpE [Clostridia bacterium]MCI9275560.1 nucleotide exchange factor GrpE [Clostridia bacterium]